tara:strand:+ start:220 stop:507 length:288 start_codon:yes stop_codon:yes gene_type:complete
VSIIKANKRVVCADGFSISIQASSFNYCSPREDDAVAYKSVELGFPNKPDPFILAYAEEQGNWTGSVYGYVPAHVVRKMIAGHGGIVSGQCPPLV